MIRSIALATVATLALTGCGAAAELALPRETVEVTVHADPEPEPELDDTVIDSESETTSAHALMQSRWDNMRDDWKHDLCWSYENDWDAAVGLTATLAAEAGLSTAEVEAFAEVVATGCFDLGYRW